MAEYIEREAFIADLEKRYCKPCEAEGKDYNHVRCRACWVDDMMGEIGDAPFADVAPVVRCGECSHRIYKIINEEVGAIGGCELYGCATPNDHYCSFGEKVKVVLD